MLTIAVAAGSNSTTKRCLAVAATLLVLVLLVASMLTVTLAAWPTVPLGSSVDAVADLPLEQWFLMQQAAAASGCGLDWSILAGLEKEETDFGRDPRMFEPHDGGIVGLVQMQPGNWATFAPPGGNPFDPHDALTAAAKFLCAHGATSDIRGALFAYNHADWYVADVLHWAQVYAGLLGPGLANASAPTPGSGRSTATAGAEIIRVARTWEGVPYVWGGASRAGIDCSGLVMVVFAQFGVQLKHNAQLQFNAVPHIRDDQLQSGDLVFFAQTYASSDWITHVGIYIGGGLQLNAPTEGQVVSVQPVFSGFWGAHYAGSGRVSIPARKIMPGLASDNVKDGGPAHPVVAGQHGLSFTECGTAANLEYLIGGKAGVAGRLLAHSWLVKMGPLVPADSTADGRDADPKSLREHGLAHAFAVEATHHDYLLGCELGAWRGLTASSSSALTTLPDLVRHVVRAGAQEQVGGIAARWVVARVAHQQPLRNWTGRQLPYEAMDQSRTPVHRQDSVALTAKTQPNPALGRSAAAVNLGPDPLVKWPCCPLDWSPGSPRWDLPSCQERLPEHDGYLPRTGAAPVTSAFCFLVAHVLDVCAKEQMGWVDARWVVTGMQYVQPPLDGLHRQLVGNPVRQHLSTGDRHLAVSRPITASSPDPTTVVPATSIRFAPKPVQERIYRTFCVHAVGHIYSVRKTRDVVFAADGFKNLAARGRSAWSLNLLDRRRGSDAMDHSRWHLHRQRAADQRANRRTGRFSPARFQWFLGCALRRRRPRASRSVSRLSQVWLRTNPPGLRIGCFTRPFPFLEE